MGTGEGVLVEIAVTRVVGSGPALVRARREEVARRRICVVERCIFVIWLVIEEGDGYFGELVEVNLWILGLVWGMLVVCCVGLYGAWGGI